MNLKNNCLRTGAYILIDSLVQNGVEHIFGYPGGAILPIYDELYHWEKANLIKHMLYLIWFDFIIFLIIFHFFLIHFFR